MSVSYSYTIRWTKLDGTRHTLTVGWYSRLESARYKCVLLAMKNGWKPPRWWEFWRIGDTTARQILS